MTDPIKQIRDSFFQVQFGLDFLKIALQLEGPLVIQVSNKDFAMIKSWVSEHIPFEFLVQANKDGWRYNICGVTFIVKEDRNGS